MIPEEKKLLFKDLCSRLPYDCKVAIAEGGIDGLQWDNVTLNSYLLYQIEEEDGWEYVKPYLRSMSSMTEEEYKELKEISEYYGFAPFIYIDDWCPNYDMTDWLNAHHFDYRGLIRKGLAIEVTKENNPYK